MLGDVSKVRKKRIRKISVYLMTHKICLLLILENIRPYFWHQVFFYVEGRPEMLPVIVAILAATDFGLPASSPEVIGCKELNEVRLFLVGEAAS